MRAPVRRLVFALAVTTLTACGSDGGNDPSFRYPDVGGTYAVQGTFDLNPSVTFDGTLGIYQADRNDGDLTGTLAVTVRGLPSGDETGAGSVYSVSMDEDGHVVIELAAPTDEAGWRFSGQLAGDRITGRHTVRSSAGSASGDWTAER
jgi:hypothetical protein